MHFKLLSYLCIRKRNKKQLNPKTQKGREIMKAYKITSTEYRANQASVFVFVNGEYFGDLAYVRRENYPQDINHWMEATCADSDRYFIVKEVEISEEHINELRQLHADLEENAKNFIPYTDYVPGLSKKEREADRQENIRREELNRPFYAKAREINNRIEDIISSL